MAWEARRDRKYFYKACRDHNGQVRREYLGAGPRAQAAAAEIEKAKAEDQHAKALVARMEGEQAGLDAEGLALDEAIRDVAAGVPSLVNDQRLLVRLCAPLAV